MVEYVEGIFKQDLATVEGEIKLAESDLSRSEDRLDWARACTTRAMSRRRPAVSEELTLKKARFALEQAESKKKVLVDYTKGEDDQGAQSEVEKARSDELAKKATWELEVSKEKKLERQIAACEIMAPATAWSSMPTIPTGPSAAASPRSRKGRPFASVRRSSACRTSPACRSTPRFTSRRSTSWQSADEGQDSASTRSRPDARRHA